MRKIYKLLQILWSFRDRGNRKEFVMMLRKFLDEVDARALATQLVSPYEVDVLSSGVQPKILLVVHQFSRTGAPYAALNLARALASVYGVKPVVISPEEGPLREEFIREGYTTIIDPFLFKYQKFSEDACSFVAKFDRVIVNSLYSIDFIRYFRGVAKKLNCWVHETEEVFWAVANSGTDLSLMLAACESIWIVSPICMPPALQYAAQEKLHPLLYGCPDMASSQRAHKSEKIVFSIVGTLEKRKGQDIFLDAVEQLPEGIRRKASFRIIGSPNPYDKTSAIFSDSIRAKAARLAEVELFENMPSGRLQEYYAETDVVVSASRKDPMPIVITEGMMHSKVCLCSSAIGHAQLLDDGINGLIFTTESASELSTKMAWAIQHSSELTDIGIAGRAVYERHFLMKSFITNLQNLIQPER